MDTFLCGDLIKQSRKSCGYTQEELAKRANISRTYLADIERNRYNPSMATLQNISHALGVSIHELLPQPPVIRLSPVKQELLYKILREAVDKNNCTPGFAIVRSGAKMNFFPILARGGLGRINSDDLFAVARFLDVDDEVIELLTDIDDSGFNPVSAQQEVYDIISSLSNDDLADVLEYLKRKKSESDSRR